MAEARPKPEVDMTRETRNHPPVNGCTIAGPHPCVLSVMPRQDIPPVVAIVARCGRTDPHGYHRFAPGARGWCVGNVNVITEQRALEIDAESLANAAEMGVYSEINPASDEEII